MNKKSSASSPIYWTIIFTMKNLVITKNELPLHLHQQSDPKPYSQESLPRNAQRKQEERQCKISRRQPDHSYPCHSPPLGWANKIFCMEEEHKLYITYLYLELEKKIAVLNIPDLYARESLELILVLREKLKKNKKDGINVLSIRLFSDRAVFPRFLSTNPNPSQLQRVRQYIIPDTLSWRIVPSTLQSL